MNAGGVRSLAVNRRSTRRGGQVYAYEMDEKAVRGRLRRIEGQVRGLQRMIDDDARCIDVLTQLNSVQAALRAVGLGLLDEHVRRCLRESADGGNGETGIEELMTAVGRLAR